MQGTTVVNDNRRRRKRWKLTPRFWLLIGLAFLAYMSFSYATGFVQIWRLNREIRQIEEEISRAEARNEQLREELSYLQSDEYVEKVAREELGLVKPGETAVYITSPDEVDN